MGLGGLGEGGGVGDGGAGDGGGGGGAVAQLGSGEQSSRAVTWLMGALAWQEPLAALHAPVPPTQHAWLTCSLATATWGD